MSERGVFAVDRGIWDDPDFPNEPFSEREAFLWLVGEAAWRPTKVRVGSRTISLERGQCSFSTRFMAVKFQWSEARVRRFLQRRSDMNQLCIKTDAGATQVTICKYDAFQRVGLPTDAEATQKRRTSDAKKKQGNISPNGDSSNRDERVTALMPVLDLEHAEAIHEHRTIRSPKDWTVRAAGMMAKELAKAPQFGFTANEAAEAVIRNAWTGFQIGWIAKDRPRQGGARASPDQPRKNGSDLMIDTTNEMLREMRGENPDDWRAHTGGTIDVRANSRH